MLIHLLKTHLLKYKKVLLYVLGLQIVATSATLMLPRLNADIIDKGVIAQDMPYIYKMGAVMLLVTLVQVGFAIAAVFFASKAAMGFGRDVRANLFHKVTDFSTKEVAVFGAPSLITRITNDVQQVQMLVLMSCTLLVAAPITIIGGVIMAISEDGPLSLLLLVSVPVLIISIGSVIWRLIPTFGVMQVRIDRINQILREQITGMRVVRAFIREPHEKARFSVGNDDLTETSLRAGRLMAFMFPAVMFILNASSVAAIWFGADRIGSGQMRIGSLIAFLTYLVQILMSVMMATFVAVMAPRAAVCADRIQEVLDTDSSVADPTNAITSLSGPASLEMRDVSFAYPGAESPVLSNISFRVEAGQTLAIIGSTGSGKTTLLNLVPRLFDVTSGQVLVNGVNVRDIEPELLWAQTGLVPQKPYLFSGTVASNLRYGDPDATDEELWASLAVAQGEDFVRGFSDGLDSTITQGGTNVSGGQRQRLAIARALVRKPGIFLFDDSFSALDLATDARLRAALGPVTTESVMVVVAQRVSTIAQADQILVLEDGRSVGLGTHQELLESCPTYQEIVDSQMTEEEAA